MEGTQRPGDIYFLLVICSHTGNYGRNLPLLTMNDELPPKIGAGVPPPLAPPLIQSIPPPLPPSAPEKKRRSWWPLGIAVVLAIVLAGLVIAPIVRIALSRDKGPRQQSPGTEAFHQADLRIISGDGAIALGNTPAAVSLAKDYSKSLKVLREDFFTKSKEGAFSLTKGEFITFCQWNGDSCVFLVHVPDLRHFTHSAKKSLAELAWINAQSVLQAQQSRPAPQTVVVALKGALLYDAIMIGDYIAEPANRLDGIRTRESGLGNTPLLYPFFAPAAETVTPQSR